MKPFSKDPEIEKSLRHSLHDGVSYSIMVGVSETYFAAYAVLLKASTQQIGLLAALPPLLASFTQLFAVWLGHRTGKRRHIIVAGALIQVFALLMVASLPGLFPEWSFPALIGSVILYFIGPNLGAPLWASLMGAIVPEGIRGRFFGLRTRLSSISSFLSLLTAGGILQTFDSIGKPLVGFICIFSIGIIARCYSAYHLKQKHEPPILPDQEPDRIVSWSFLKQHPNFLRFSFFFFCMQFAVAISGPFVVVYLLRDLHFSYLELTLNTGASVLMQFVVLNRWGRLGDLFGNRIILRVTGFAIPFIPLLWTLSSNYYYLLILQIFSGLIWSGYSLSASNFLFDLTPAHRRAGMLSAHNVAAGIGVFLGALLGGYIATVAPHELSLPGFQPSVMSVFMTVFVASAIIRLIVALSFLPRIQEVRAVKRMTYRGLIFRVTRFSPISGVNFECFTSFARKKR
jgi:MFS family permease